MKKGVIAGLATLLVAGLLSPLTHAFELEKLVVLGSRFEERSVSDSPVPVDVITEEEIVATGQTEVGRVIQELVPSFNFSSSTISDGTDALRPATLRGLGPDQVLVLVNGKRRHKSALIHVNTSVGRGTAGVDMNAIPVSAIKRIEVLRDGASAQYGSDAISGVINIVLKDGYDGKITASAGQLYEGDGETLVASLNKGFSLGGESVVNVTLEIRDRKSSNRAGLMGDIHYPGTELIDNPAVCAGKSGCNQLTAPSADNDNQKEIDLDRDAFRVGDADSTHVSFVANMRGPVDFMDGEVYSFFDLSVRDNESGGFYRRANQLPRNPVGSDYPDGFLPLINTRVNDYAFGAGFEADLTDNVAVDLSYVVGGNTFAFEITDSHNASWVECRQKADKSGCIEGIDYTGLAQTSADAGELKLFQHTVNLDFTSSLSFGSFAWGGEYRREKYEIASGEPYSYLDYDRPGGGSGGIQVFPGFKPQNEVSEARDAFGAYAETEFDLGEILLLSPAVRYENYSDFGNTFNGKLSARAQLAESFALRGSASTGFRSPSMQQIYFNNISTQFRNVDGQQVAFDVGTFRNDSDVAREFGVPELKEETSRNFSAGFVFNPIPALTITTDFYYVTIDDRIILSGTIGDDDVAVVSDAIKQRLRNAGAETAQFFMNAADTTTKGVDIVASYNHSFADSSALNLVFAGTVNETEITDVNLPLSLPESLFTAQDRSIVEEWQPKDRFSLSGTYSRGPASLLVAVHRYGEYTVVDGDNQTFGAKYLTDASLSVDVGKMGTFKIGANNLFDVKPDKNEIGQSRGGTIYDHEGNLVVDSPGVFTYSRRSAPFGINGGYYYLAYEYAF
ncbi:MAG: TonB-dependent receptor [Candidatus Dadabacteria bacterium]|nr:TonB-dependent receptor [Candidatus Dadabacteria bacterium]